MYAAAGGHPEICDMLLARGADVNAIHKQGGSPLLEAATNGSVRVMDILLKAGADPLVVDDDGVTSLMSAASQGHLSEPNPSKVQVDAVANSGGTALMFAASGGYTDTVEYLIEQKCDVNVVVKATSEYKEQVAAAVQSGAEDVEPHVDGVTALTVAAQGGYLATCKLLVEAGAVVDIRDEDDMTPLLYAMKGSHAETKYLVEHGANPNDVYVDDKQKSHNLLMDSIIANNTDFALELLEKGADANYADDDGVTVLTQASYQGRPAIVRGPAHENADTSLKNKEGINPLQGLLRGHVEIAEDAAGSRQEGAQ